MSPRSVSHETGSRDASWSGLTLQDFTNQSWDALDEAERRRIAGFFAWAAEMPPSTFGDLKLGHHDPGSGRVNWRGLVAATGRLNQTDIPAADMPAVMRHLRGHYADFGVAPADMPEMLRDVGETASPFKNVRAFSVLTVKSVNEDERIITGIASTPETDRQGDILESTGAKFSLPMAFLWQHDQGRPIGEITAAAVTPNGIEVQARVAKIAEPGPLRDRIDEAWQSIKARLVRGLSVGLKPLEAAPIKGSNGLRISKWLWLETSAVTIPANQAATILAVKQWDVPTASGQDVPHNPSPGASGSKTKARGSPMKTVAEQIETWKATKQQAQDRMAELMTKAAEENITLDAAQTEEYDGLDTQVKNVNDHITRLEALEKIQKDKAVAVVGKTQNEGTEARGGVVVSVKDNLPPGIEFARYAMCVAAAKGNAYQALEMAKSRYPDQPRIQLALKSAVEAGTTTDPTWAGALVVYQNFAGDFIEFLRPATIIGKFGTGNVPSLRRVPFNIRIVGQTSGGSGYWVGQAKAKPLTKFDFAPVTMKWAKVASIAVLSEELVRFSNPSSEALVRDAIAAAIIERIDIDFVDPYKDEVADVSPASITNGVTAIPSSGTDFASIQTDIQAIMGAFISANITPTSGVWIMNSSTALALSLMVNALGQRAFPDITMTGGTFQGLPVIVSQYVGIPASPSNNIVILANASDIYLADDGQVVIDASREASVEMSDAPIQAAGGAGSPGEVVGATSMVSLWQSNLLGLRAERFINWKKRRADAVAYLDGVNWTAAGSPV